MNIESIIDAIKSVLPSEQHVVGLHEPCFEGNEWEYIKDCLDTRWVSSVGKYVDQFEAQLAEFTGVKRAIAVCNGTAALHLCLQLVGVKPGDEVFVPALTFVATANAVVYCGAIPHFVDSELKTLGLDPAKLRCYLREIAEMRADGCYNKLTGRRIKAVVPMHTFGHPVDLDPLVELCAAYKLELIEDAAESLGSYYRGRHTGNWGKVAAVSFNGNKIITTGGGGAILTNDEELGKLAKHISTQAKIPHKWEYNHDRVGYNYRMPNINAALGCAQLEKLADFVDNKRALAKRYKQVLSGITGIQFFSEPEFACSNYWLNVILLADEYIYCRDLILHAAHDKGILARPAWTLLNELPMYKSCPHMDLFQSSAICQKLINIPSSVFL